MNERDELAALINGGPLPQSPDTVGGIYERHTAYERADAIIAAGWQPRTECSIPPFGSLPCLICGDVPTLGGFCEAHQ